MLYDKKWELDKVGKNMHEAADLLEKKGWCRYFLKKSKWHVEPGAPDGQMCILGVLGQVVAGNPYDLDDVKVAQAMVRVHKYLNLDDTFPFRQSQVVSWNNDNNRTQEEVVTALREAAYVKEKVE